MAHSFLLDQSLPAVGLGDSTNAQTSLLHQPTATKPAYSTVDEEQQAEETEPQAGSTPTTNVPQDASDVSQNSLDPLRELSRLIPDKSIVTQPPAPASARSFAAADQTCNLSAWQPVGLDSNVSNIMNESFPPAALANRTLADASTGGASFFDRSVALQAARATTTAAVQSSSHVGDATTFHKLDTKSLDQTMLLDESLPHQLPDVSSISFFHSSQSHQQSQQQRNLRKSPSKLVKPQPMIQEEEDGSSEDEAELGVRQDFERVLQMPKSPSRRDLGNENYQPAAGTPRRGALVFGAKDVQGEKVCASPRQRPLSASPARQANTASQVSSQVNTPPKFFPRPSAAAAPSHARPTAAAPPTSASKLSQRLSVPHSSGAKRVGFAPVQAPGHKRQSSVSVKPREAMTTKNAYAAPGPSSRSAEERIHGMLRRPHVQQQQQPTAIRRQSAVARPLSHAQAPAAPSESAAMRTPSKNTTTSLRQQERSAVRSRTYEDFKDLLGPQPSASSSAAVKTPSSGITRSRTFTTLSSQQAGSASASSSSAMPKSRTSTKLAGGRAQLPQPSGLKTGGGGMVRSKSTPSVPSSSAGAPAPKKRVSLLPPPSTARKSAAATSAAAPATHRMSTALGQTPAPLGSRFGQPAAAAAMTSRPTSSRTVRVAEPGKGAIRQPGAVARQRL